LLPAYRPSYLPASEPEEVIMALSAEAAIPDSKLARAVSEFIRDTETELLFNHSSRVYHFGALAGVRRGLKFDRELLYTGCMFHDIGLMPSHSSKTERFEVDGAHAARDFLKSQGLSEEDAYTVWTAIALHTTPGVPVHMHPVVALVTAGVEIGCARPDVQRILRRRTRRCGAGLPSNGAFQGRHHPGVLRRDQTQA
jgi:HD domain